MFCTFAPTETSSSQLLHPALNRHLRDLIHPLILSCSPTVSRFSRCLHKHSLHSRTSNPYLSATSFPRNLPPTKCLIPRKNSTLGFGAVKLIRYSGMNPWPTCPSAGGPEVTFQLLGVSTERTGFLVVESKVITVSNGGRTGGWKEKPKSASTTRSVVERAGSKSEVKGMCRALSWVIRRVKRGA